MGVPEEKDDSAKCLDKSVGWALMSIPSCVKWPKITLILYLITLCKLCWRYW